jgi:hypothetical protein
MEGWGVGEAQGVVDNKKSGRDKLVSVELEVAAGSEYEAFHVVVLVAHPTLEIGQGFLEPVELQL